MNSMKRIYAIMALVGLIVPYSFFLSFLLAEGVNVTEFFRQLFANDIATFFVTDLIITAVICMLFYIQEARRKQMRWVWVYVVATLVVGPSFSLPLFLYAREGKGAVPSTRAL